MKKIKLKKSIDFDGNKITEVNFNEALTARAIIEAEDAMIINESVKSITLPPGATNNNRLLAHVIAKAIDMPIMFVESLFVADFTALRIEASNFLA